MLFWLHIPSLELLLDLGSDFLPDWHRLNFFYVIITDTRGHQLLFLRLGFVLQRC